MKSSKEISSNALDMSPSAHSVRRSLSYETASFRRGIRVSDTEERGAFVDISPVRANNRFEERSYIQDRDLPRRNNVLISDKHATAHYGAFSGDSAMQPPYFVATHGSAIPIQLLQNSAALQHSQNPQQGNPCAPPLAPPTMFPSRSAAMGQVTSNFIPIATSLPVTPASFALQVSPRQPLQPARMAGNIYSSAMNSNMSSSTTSKGRKKSWWVVNCFQEKYDENGRLNRICVACQEYKTVVKNASRLAAHLWKCVQVDQEVKDRLFDDCTYIRNNVNSYSKGKPELYKKSQHGASVSKKRRIDGSGSKHVALCTSEDIDEISILLLRAVLEHCIPLTIFDKTESRSSAFEAAFLRGCPGLRGNFPSRHKIMTKYLPKLYNETLSAVKTSLEDMLSHGFGTVIFDGWDDITMSSVVNVLVRVEANGVRKTFFLDSVFTKHNRMTAAEYVRIVERVMGQFGGMKHICGVASDSARACVNARKALADKYGGLVGIQDQAHVADLLMKDIGKLHFVKDVIDKVNMIVVETRSKRKLLSFLRDEMKRSNKIVREEERVRVAENHELPGTTIPDDPFHPDRLFPPLRKTAIMLRKPANTRFASISDTLEAFIRCRETLVRIIYQPEFKTTLFTAEKPEQEVRRDYFCELISDVGFLKSVKELHMVFRLCRRYLRMFDKETGTSIADVVGCTIFLEEALNKVPASDEYLTDERLEIIKACFRKRKDGPTGGRGMQVRLIENVHIAACLLHPTKFPADFQEYNARFYEFVKGFVCSRLLPEPDEAGGEEENEDKLEDERDSMVDKIMHDYVLIHSRWNSQSRRLRRNAAAGNHPRSHHNRDEYGFRKSPFRFWTEEQRVGNCPELCELALRTLSISPSSCAAERSFSVQGRVRTKLRNRLDPDAVRKMMFVRWNIRHYDETFSEAVDRIPVATSKGVRAEFLSKEDNLLSSDDSGSEGSASDRDDIIDLVEDLEL